MRRIGVTAAALLFVAQLAHAMAVIEFIKINDATKQREALEPIYGFLSRGYKSLETVAEEAAVRAGMNR